MAAGDGGPIPAGEASSEAWEGAGEVEDKGRKVLVEGIDERGPEEGGSKEGGDGGASGRAPLVSGRREEEKGGNDSRVPQEGKISGCYTSTGSDEGGVAFFRLQRHRSTIKCVRTSCSSLKHLHSQRKLCVGP